MDQDSQQVPNDSSQAASDVSQQLANVSDQAAPGNQALDSLPSQQATRPSVAVTVPDSASDSDLIEKEWVEKAKEIVEHTRNDPYEQQRAMSIMKAEYMKKRYNKDIKLNEDE